MSAELNTWLAVELFGVRLLTTRPGAHLACAWDLGTEENEQWMFHDDPGVFRSMVDDYSGTYDGMGAVIEAMRAKGYELQMNGIGPGHCRARFFTEASTVHWDRQSLDGTYYQFADDFPPAVALAAKAAIESEKA